MPPKLRPSPSASASAFHVGTKKVGNDGNAYVVSETKAGVRRWVPAVKAAKAAKDSTAGGIMWRTTNPVNSAHMGFRGDTDDRIPVPADVWNAKLPVRKGDRVALVFFDGAPAVTAPVKGGTVRDMFDSIAAGMQKRIDADQFRTAYAAIGAFLVTKPRTGILQGKSLVVQLVEKLEAGTLTPYDLVRDNYDFYEGNLSRTDGIWTYAVGS
jgi:hypothetical protein